MLPVSPSNRKPDQGFIWNHLSLRLNGSIFIPIILSIAFILFYAHTSLSQSFVLDQQHDHREQAYTSKIKLTELTGNDFITPGSLKCSGLVPFYDKIIPTSGPASNNETHTNNHDTIPPIIHVTYPSRCLPQDLAEYLNKWSEALPNYSIYLHDDQAVDTLLNSQWLEFPFLQQFLKCVQHLDGMRAHFWRLLVIYKYGGIYIDIYDSPGPKIKEIDLLIHNLTNTNNTTKGSQQQHQQQNKSPSYLSGILLSDHYEQPYFHFFAFEAKHPILYFTMMTFMRSVWELQSLDQEKDILLKGPVAYKKGLEKFVYDNNINNLKTISGGCYMGLYNKMIRKISSREKGDHIQSRVGSFDMVPHPYYPAMEITREERIKKQAIPSKKQAGKYLNLSCKKYTQKVTDNRQFTT